MYTAVEFLIIHSKSPVRNAALNVVRPRNWIRYDIDTISSRYLLFAVFSISIFSQFEQPQQKTIVSDHQDPRGGWRDLSHQFLDWGGRISKYTRENISIEFYVLQEHKHRNTQRKRYRIQEQHIQGVSKKW